MAIDNHNHKGAPLVPPEDGSPAMSGREEYSAESAQETSLAHDDTATARTRNEGHRIVLPIRGRRQVLLEFLQNTEAKEADKVTQETQGTDREDDELFLPTELAPAVVDDILELLFPDDTSTPIDFQDWLGQLSSLLTPYLDVDPLLGNTLTPSSYLSEYEDDTELFFFLE